MSETFNKVENIEMQLKTQNMLVLFPAVGHIYI